MRRDAVAALVLSVVGLASLRATIQVYLVPSGAMVPTIEPQSRVITRRGAVEPARGDIVVFASSDRSPST